MPKQKYINKSGKQMPCESCKKERGAGKLTCQLERREVSDRATPLPDEKLISIWRQGIRSTTPEEGLFPCSEPSCSAEIVDKLSRGVRAGARNEAVLLRGEGRERG
jgi:hypothetical protein